ncbi:HWE histidine kinase domain-containing protein [Pseudopontixanthobacter vadosimaris]|uniref:HWE histidine kinase domain-containing protein n=1 Tax=Pseudopontixanthobacter vadosimaris TaxID=2726450 RepID=UPI001472A370|nr:HWE histidine kinase domain-containing protein [Pseudopontixanthobacter vadosimaris]
MPHRSASELRHEIARLEDELAAASAARAQDAATARDAAQRITHLEAALDVVPVGVIIADLGGRILLGNRQVEVLLRHPVLHSRDVDSYDEWVSFHGDGRRVAAHEYPLSRIIRNHADHAELEVHYQRGDGTRFWMNIIGEPVTDREGNRIGAAVALVDIEAKQQMLARQKTLIAELDHRVKNAFAVVKSIVSQSLRTSGVPAGLRETLDHRLDAYAKAHARLVGSRSDHEKIGLIAGDIVSAIAGERAQMHGPEVALPSRQAMALSMAFYELGTNAVKYGALSAPQGSIDLRWHIEAVAAGERHLIVDWLERGGPPAVEPETKGFGSFIVKRAIEAETGGRVRFVHGEEGLEWHLAMPLPAHAPEAETENGNQPRIDHE